MLSFPQMLLMAAQQEAGGTVHPEVEMTAASFLGGETAGYIRPGGIVAGLFGDSGGSLSGTILTGYVTDAILDSEGYPAVFFEGDATGDLASVTHLIIDGTPYAISNIGYESGEDVTSFLATTAPGFTASQSYDLQLSEGS